MKHTLKKVLFIASTGGHLSELMQLKPLFKEYDSYLVTEKTKSTMGLKDVYQSRLDFLVYGTKSHLFSYLFKFTFNIIKSFVIFMKIRPDVIVTTGTHTAVPMCYIAKLFKKKVIFIETFANSKTKTKAGELVYPIADVFIVQWESMLECYPKAIYGVDILILVTLGTNDKSFERLLIELERLIDLKVINEKVVVQAGYTKYQTKKMEMFDLIPMEKFDEFIQTCDLLITHGGVGSIISGLKSGKKVIAVPRLEKYGEHVNDHQLQIIENFDSAGYIIGIKEMDELQDALMKVRTFTPRIYQSNVDNMIKLIKTYIDN